MGAEDRLAELKLELPPAPKPVATYVTAMRHGRPALRLGPRPAPVRRHDDHRQGSAPTWTSPAGRPPPGRPGLAILATVRGHLGSLDKVVRLVKSLGMVNCTPDFAEQPKVINGFSDLMVEVFGEAGKGARSAVGMGALPGGIAVEIEAIFQVKD